MEPFARTVLREFSMWFTIALSYCAVCWIMAAGMTCFWAPQFAATAAARGVSPLTFQLGAILIAPLAMPFILWSVLQMLWMRNRRLRELRHCLTTVREYEFAKVNSLHLVESIRHHFQRHTPALFQLGFNLVGDYRMKSQPVEVHDRIFLSADGETLATICAVLQRGGVSMISILTDGTCVNTTSSKNPKPARTVEPTDQLCLTYLPDTSIEEQFQQHQALLRELCTTRDASVITQHVDQFREVLVYDQRIFNRWRFRHGDLQAPPPAPDFQTLNAPDLAPANA